MNLKAILAQNPLSKYVRESYHEMKKVAWPTRNVIIRHSILVIGISAGIALFFGVLDALFAASIEKLITIF